MNRIPANCPNESEIDFGFWQSRRTLWRCQRKPVRSSASRGAFLLLLVMLVIAMASLAMLNFSRAMLISNETSQISSGRLQARLCAESGAQAVRVFLSLGHLERTAMGGTWANPNFQARNVIPHIWPQRRGNYTIISPALDEYGNYGGIPYGLQNESAKLNLNTLLRLDLLASTGALSPAEPTGADGGEGGGASGLQSFTPKTSEDGSDAAVNMLMALPGMTMDVAHAILDWMDTDNTPRDYGAESDTYTRMQPPYQASNGPLDSIEQLLGAGLLHNYCSDTMRIETAFGPLRSFQRLNMGLPPGSMPSQINVAALDPQLRAAAPLGLASYLTLHSRERNLAQDGSPRVFLNQDDLQTLYSELSSALGKESWASFIVAYRFAGRPANSMANPLNVFANLTAGLEATGGLVDAIGQDPLADASGQPGRTAASPVEWATSALDQLDLSGQGRVQFQQVLDLFDATVTLGEGDEAITYLSPFRSTPSDLAIRQAYCSIA